MNANLQWMTGYTGNRSIAMMLFRNPQDTGLPVQTGCALWSIERQWVP